jgi:hypothetical protein
MLHILVPYDMNFDVVSKRLTVSYVLSGLGLLAALLFLPVWLYGTTRLLRQVYGYLYDSVDIVIAEMTVSLREEA